MVFGGDRVSTYVITLSIGFTESNCGSLIRTYVCKTDDVDRCIEHLKDNSFIPDAKVYDSTIDRKDIKCQYVKVPRLSKNEILDVSRVIHCE